MNPLWFPCIFNILVLIPVGLLTLLGGERGGQLACQNKFPPATSTGFHQGAISNEAASRHALPVPADDRRPSSGK